MARKSLKNVSTKHLLVIFTFSSSYINIYYNQYVNFFTSKRFTYNQSSEKRIVNIML